MEPTTSWDFVNLMATWISASPDRDQAPEPSSETSTLLVTESVLRDSLHGLGVGLDLAAAISMSVRTAREALVAVLSSAASDLASVRHQVDQPPLPLDVAHVPRPPEERVAPLTSWNDFQRRLSGTGLSRSEVSALYREEQLAVQAATAGQRQRHTVAAPSLGGGVGLGPGPASPAPGRQQGRRVAQLPREEAAAPQATAVTPPGTIPLAAPSGATAMAPGAARDDAALSPRSALSLASAAAAPGRAPLELGYLALRLPGRLQHLRGHHRCSWAAFLQRLGVDHAEWQAMGSQHYTPRFRNIALATEQ